MRVQNGRDAILQILGKTKVSACGQPKNLGVLQKGGEWGRADSVIRDRERRQGHPRSGSQKSGFQEKKGATQNLELEKGKVPCFVDGGAQKWTARPPQARYGQVGKIIR